MNLILLLTALFLQPLALAEECTVEPVNHKCLLRVWPIDGGDNLIRKEWEFEVPIYSGDCVKHPHHYETFSVPGSELHGDLYIDADNYRMEFRGAGNIIVASAYFPWTRANKVSDLTGFYKGNYFTLMCGVTPWPW